MGLLDQMTGMLGGQSGKLGQYQAILSWLESQGGIQGVLDKFRQGGLGALVESWISSGVNLPVSADQITSVLGSPAIGQLAEKLGMNTQGASSLIAEYLPKVIDGLSPDGQVPAQQDLLSEGLNLLKGKLFS